MREKLIVAFGLMSVLPLLVLGYVVINYVYPHAETGTDLTLIIVLAVVIAVLGLAVARSLVMPVIKLASEARAIAAGETGRSVEVKAPGELGELGDALNQISKRVRDNMGQLKIYGEQTKHLNLEINRRILSLSHILQISNLITQGVKLEEVRSFVLEKLAQFEGAELSALLEPGGADSTFIIRAAVGVDPTVARPLVEKRLVSPWLQRALDRGQVLVVDGQHGEPHEREHLQQLLGMSGGVCQPLTAGGQGVALLLTMNRSPDYAFDDDAMELLRVFAKQMAIAIENDLLVRRAEALKVIDDLTGLYNAAYMRSRLDEELRRAMRYHRPCSLLTFNVDEFRQVQELYGGLTAEGVLKAIAELVKTQVTDVDRVGRMGPDEFAVILPERNKREALEAGEAICRAIRQYTFLNGTQRIPKPLTISLGLSENPLDGSTAEELWAKAAQALAQAKGQGKNRVVAC
ncbi:MAG: diguanylate cyclase [Candidatus Omnitrophica bacterium]|nr:diguanylate cyclase [Candidatus Omnitrophota bacterium]